MIDSQADAHDYAGGPPRLPEPLEPIAIVGIGCRFPGGADSPARLWQLLREGFDAIAPIPADRFDVDSLYAERPATPGKIMSRWGGYLNEIDRFDADFFGISPREAERLDPQQRLLLEVTWEALEDAGIPPSGLSGTAAGVFVGLWLNDFEARLFADPGQLDLYMTTGSGRYSASGRLSYFFDLLGPSLTVDTACSSSLVAVHLACQSLRSGDSSIALAGGANVILQPHITIAYSQSRMMAPDGRCKFGDAAANGYVRSDGAAMVVLKRLSDARADGDPIYAVIRGSAVTNDGRSSGFLATPGQPGQAEMLRRAYAAAGVEPRTVDYVEAHGTGTSAGDPVELGALGEVVGVGRPADQPCLVGSIKTNTGHTEGAAGVAGLIKVALSLHNRWLPASLHVTQPNPAIPWEALGLRICSESRSWPGHGRPALAGVSSFGIAGTNAHVVVEEAPAVEPDRAAGRDDQEQTHILPLSARGEGGLRALAQRYRTLLAEGGVPFADLCAAAAVRRDHLERRLAVVAQSNTEAITALDAYGRGERPVSVVTGESGETPPRLVFVFPGQGAQWEGMGRRLLETEPVFAHVLEECDAAIRAEAGWSVLERLRGEVGAGWLDEIDEVQPVLFAVMVGLAALWQSWGVAPDAVVGHSMGEVAAAHVAGILTLEDAVRVICRRSKLMRRVRGQGLMAVVELSRAEAAAALAGYEQQVAIAVSNSPRSTVLSGEPGAVSAIVEKLQGQGVFCRLVKVDVASHSPQMDGLLGELGTLLVGLRPQAGAIPLYSTVDVRVVDGARLDGGYWVRNLRQPVLFGEAVAGVSGAGRTLFVEMSPHPLLLPAVEQVLADGGGEGQALPSLRRQEPERATLLATLGALHVQGVAVDWRALYPSVNAQVQLPTYPWQRERFWWEAAPSSAEERRGGHPLLGHSLRPADAPGRVVWQGALGAERLAWLADHQVRGAAVLPATGFAELALVAAENSFPGPHALEQLALYETLGIPAQGERAIQVALEQQASGAIKLQIYSSDEGASDGQPLWRLNAEGILRRGGAPAAAPYDSPDRIGARCNEELPAEEHYRRMEERALRYGPAFRTVAEGWRGDGEALARLTPPADMHGHGARIALLDGALQLAVATLPESTAGRTFLPVGIERLRIDRWPEEATDLWAHAVLTGEPERSIGATHFLADVFLLDSAGTLLAQVRGLRLQQAASERGTLDELLYELQWEAQPRPAVAAAPDGPGSWLLFADSGEGDSLAAALTARGERCTVPAPPLAAPERYRAALREKRKTGASLRGVICLWGDTLAPDAAESAATSTIELIQAITESGGDLPRLWLVTRRAQPVGLGTQPIDSAQAAIWGVGRVAASEIPGLRCTLIDLSASRTLSAPRTADETASLAAEIWAGACGLPDAQVALRGNDRFTPRLVRRLLDGDAPPTQTLTETEEVESYRIAAELPGALDSLRPRLLARRTPGPGEVEVRVQAAGINFLDVLKALGVYPGVKPSPEVALGAECAGTVVAVGPGVTSLRPGDEVIAITSSYTHIACLGRFVTVPEQFALPRPAMLSVEEAAGMPVVFMTAWYALHELGRMRRGERALIHAAAGGVGLAALQLCRRAGVDVIATAGSPEKRERLRSLGVEHVLDSRTLDFADEVLAITDGRGVDLVLNSLTGEAIARGMACLAPRGRFLEIGKRDIYANSRIGLEPFKRSLSFFAIDLAGMTEDAPDEVAALFRTVIDLAAAGEIQPLPTQAAPAVDAEESFRTMAQARHVGKLVLTFDERPVSVPMPLFRPDATYLITGGLGGLGLELARRLVARGVRHLALIGRSTPSESARAALAELEAAGAQVLPLAADVAQIDSLRSALAEIDRQMPPLRGIFHAAGVLADATLAQLDRTRLHAALAPKVQGGWNLHALTLDRPLDVFVCFSSVAALLGLAGQANYAAGNAFLDALAQQRRRMGLPALSVNWGPWADVGLAAAEEARGARLAERGLGSLTVQEGLDALEELMRADATQATVARIDAARWLEHDPASAPLLVELSGTAEHAASAEARPAKLDLRAALLATEAGRPRRSLIEEAVRRQLAHVLRIAPERIDRRRPLKALGLDSLMALELRNRLESETGLSLSATLAFNYPTVALLGEFLAGRMQIPLDVAESAIESADLAEPEEDESDALSPDEIDALLSDELAAVDRLLNAD